MLSFYINTLETNCSDSIVSVWLEERKHANRVVTVCLWTAGHRRTVATGRTDDLEEQRMFAAGIDADVALRPTMLEVLRTRLLCTTVGPADTDPVYHVWLCC